MELVKAFGELCKDSRFTAKLVLVGETHPRYFPSVQREIDRLALKDRVLFVGQVQPDQLPALYRGAKMAVFSSGAETISCILQEMMRCGCASAVSNRGPMPEIARDSAVYYDPADPAQVADAIGEVYYNPDKQTQLGDRAFELSLDFTWPKAGQKTLEAIRNVHGIWRAKQDQ